MPTTNVAMQDTARQEAEPQTRRRLSIQDRVQSFVMGCAQHESHEGGDINGVDRVLDVEKVKDRFGRFRNIRNGYYGLALFLAFMIAYIVVLGQQHHTATVGEANDAFQTFFEKAKGDLKAQDTAALYKFASTKLATGLMEGTWTNTTRSGKMLAGRTSLKFFHIIGGLIITAVKGPVHDCFRGNPCYSTETVKDAFYQISVKGEKFSVPYSEQFGGYSVFVPSSISQAEVKELFAAYEGLFGLDTRDISIHAVMFNPSNQKTLTSLRVGGKISVFGNIDWYTELKSVPYHFYFPDGKVHQIMLEVGLLCFVLWAFVRPLCQYVFCEPGGGNQVIGDNPELRKRWDAWIEMWAYIPVFGGKPILKIPATLWIVFFGSVCLWANLGFLYLGMGNFGDEKFDGIFTDPFANKDGGIIAKMNAALVAMHDQTLPSITLVDQISVASKRYFCTHVVVMTLCVVRLQQYLSFQKRLGVVTNTFQGIADDLLHMGALVILVCFCFGVINSLAFGAYDPAFRYFMPSFWEMLLECFGLYKPAAATPFVQSLFKYSPHIVSSDASLTWVPYALQILFKTLVILLLFKLLMGVIMEGYKKHNKGADKAPTVREDLFDLYVEYFHYLIGYKLFKLPYVPPFHVALAVAQIKNSTERPWEKYYLGLDHVQAVEDALNAVISPEMPQRVKTQVLRNSLQRCGPKETAYVLRVYGMNHDKAEAIFTDIYTSEEYQDKLKKKEKEEAAETDTFKDTRERLEEQPAEDVALVGLQQKIMRSRCQVMARIGVADGESHHRLSQKKIFTPRDLRTVFDEFDILGLCSINHRLMRQIFRELGFDIPAGKLSNMLAEYDAKSDNQDGECDFKEFKGIMHDDRLIGHWKGLFGFAKKQGKNDSGPRTPLLTA